MFSADLNAIAEIEIIIFYIVIQEEDQNRVDY